MSERISWLRCPVCGGPAAVGWETSAWSDGEPVEQVPVEFDCSAGCPVSLDEIRLRWDEPD